MKYRVHRTVGGQVEQAEMATDGGRVIYATGFIALGKWVREATPVDQVVESLKAQGCVVELRDERA